MLSFKEACKDFVEENDHVGRFIEERCEVNGSYSVRSRDLLSYFNDWASEMSMAPMNCRSIKMALLQKGYKYKKDRFMNCIGLRIKPFETDMANI